jgi:SAM-dependent methyltransferase
MMSDSSQPQASPWVSDASLPERIEGWRVLEIGDGGGATHFGELGAAEFAAVEEPSEAAELGSAGFDLVHCSVSLESDLHPLSTCAWIWRLLKPEGTLIAGSRVLPGAEHSRYARFLGPTESPSGRGGWVPGRLALRWIVEVSGFEFDRWLAGPGPAAGDGEPVAYLQARRVERQPALDLGRQPLGR